MTNAVLVELVALGRRYKFRNNSTRPNSRGYVYSKASPELLAWVARIEDFVITNYGVKSAPFRMYQTVNVKALSNGLEESFHAQMTILNGVLKACESIPFRQLSQSISSNDSLSNLFDKFHKIVSALRVRHGNRNTLDVIDEYDVQDLLYALLKLYFADIRKEEYTPSYAGSSARMDFLLKAEKVVVEVKKTRPGLGDKELGNQLIEDVARYKSHPDCKKLICFVYDPDARIHNPSGMLNDLNKNEDDFVVEIVIKP
jgi:hypothetical protein